jgi:pimeloyl-ACP methyl ester carboxylesterase
VAAPALVLHGEMDELVPAAQAEALASALPNGTIRTLQDAGHVAYLDNPAGYCAALSEFLDRQ